MSSRDNVCEDSHQEGIDANRSVELCCVVNNNKKPDYFLFITQKTKQIWKWYIIYQNIIAHVYIHIQAFVAATLGQFPLNLENPINFAFHSNLNEFVSQKNLLIQRVF